MRRMGTSYEQFLACLRNSTARSLIGIEISDEQAEVLAADATAARAYYEVWSTNQGGSTLPSTRTVRQPGPAIPVERVLLNVSTIGRGGEPAKVRVSTSRVDQALYSLINLQLDSLNCVFQGRELMVYLGQSRERLEGRLIWLRTNHFLCP